MSAPGVGPVDREDTIELHGFRGAEAARRGETERETAAMPPVVAAEEPVGKRVGSLTGRGRDSPARLGYTGAVLVSTRDWVAF